jgi:hypothetical protein
MPLRRKQGQTPPPPPPPPPVQSLSVKHPTGELDEDLAELVLDEIDGTWRTWYSGDEIANKVPDVGDMWPWDRMSFFGGMKEAGLIACRYHDNGPDKPMTWQYRALQSWESFAPKDKRF